MMRKRIPPERIANKIAASEMVEPRAVRQGLKPPREKDHVFGRAEAQPPKAPMGSECELSRVGRVWNLSFGGRSLSRDVGA